MKQSMIRYCKWKVKEDPEKKIEKKKHTYNVYTWIVTKLQSLYVYSKDTIHKSIELFFSAPKKPIIDLNTTKRKKNHLDVYV